MARGSTPRSVVKGGKAKGGKGSAMSAPPDGFDDEIDDFHKGRDKISLDPDADSVRPFFAKASGLTLAFLHAGDSEEDDEEEAVFDLGVRLLLVGDEFLMRVVGKWTERHVGFLSGFRSAQQDDDDEEDEDEDDYEDDE
eukprot:686131-Pyramimonas_sp.AAC.1